MKGFARIALAWAVCIFLLACQSHQNTDLSQLGPPSQRLLGHWGDTSGDSMYYGARDTISGIGSFIMTHPGGRYTPQHYQVTSEDPVTQTVDVNLLFADGNSRTETDVIAADGRKLTSGTLIDDHYIPETLDRVDDTTAPETYAAANGETEIYHLASSAVTTPPVQPLTSRPQAPLFARQQAANHVHSYILWLHLTAFAILLVVSLMYFSTLGIVMILVHWVIALVGGLTCLFLLHSPIGAGMFEILVGLVLLLRAAFPKPTF